MDNVEMVQDSLEHAHSHDAPGHGAPGHGPSGHGAASSTRAAAVLVAAIAAIAVLVEMSANDRQTAYLAHDVAASDLWAQYQGKSVRRTVMEQSAAGFAIEAQAPGLDSAQASRIAAAAADAHAAAARLADDPGREGMKQVAARATAEERARDRARDLHERLERGVRGLQIAIVLIGLFMATRLGWLLAVGAALGGVSLLYAVLAGLGLV